MKLTTTALLRALRAHQWSVGDAALALGVTRQAVYIALKRKKIRRLKQPAEVISAKRRRAANARWDRMRETA